MTAPISALELDALLPKSVVLIPTWNDTKAQVAEPFRETTSDAVHRFLIPKGTSTISLDNPSRFTATLKIVRGSNKVTVGKAAVSTTAVMRVAGETNIEAFVVLSGAPNTNDQGLTRLGVQIATVP
ncbi:hypothetical protein CBE89_13095 [Corynebacterium striatum]|uniref:Uncharacterized protein n=1 Tax=Corynebacterium striatum TaxID=43770 RepID=A0A2Z2J2A1_CORST|nr:hypothetical protein [Corynebacterium striatum]ART22312.1 hypothetical protein CBE89_13095 [Corynebacterium striatum]